MVVSACTISNGMNFKVPKNDAKYHWTSHVIGKMAFYGLTPDRVRRIIRTPQRVEDGVAENTVAVMSVPPGPASPKLQRGERDLAQKGGQPRNKKSYETWVMYQKKGSKKIIISAWRYPGISPVGKQIPIPQDILEELKNEGVID